MTQKPITSEKIAQPEVGACATESPYALDDGPLTEEQANRIRAIAAAQVKAPARVRSSLVDGVGTDP